jgi:hypothetical protein
VGKYSLRRKGLIKACLEVGGDDDDDDDDDDDHLSFTYHFVHHTKIFVSFNTF